MERHCGSPCIWQEEIDLIDKPLCAVFVHTGDHVLCKRREIDRTCLPILSLTHLTFWDGIAKHLRRRGFFGRGYKDCAIFQHLVSALPLQSTLMETLLVQNAANSPTVLTYAIVYTSQHATDFGLCRVNLSPSFSESESESSPNVLLHFATVRIVG